MNNSTTMSLSASPPVAELAYGNAICYSGYRQGQSPQLGVYPSFEEISEDLNLLATNWKYIRLYDCSLHAEIVLQVIEQQSLDLKVMLGANMTAEQSNPGCPWGAQFSDEELAANQQANSVEIDRVMTLATAYPEVVFSVSVGNEASVDWTDHLVSVDSLIAYVRRLKAVIKQPITFCENYVPWCDKLEPLVAEIDFISIHTYPVWEYHTIDTALEYTQQNYYSVADRYPHTPVVITEAGWTTCSNGRGIEPWNASAELQAQYYQLLMAWVTEQKILTFVFEAFDEPWKGSDDPLEPEKHWGLYTIDRQPKLVMEALHNQRLQDSEVNA
jgi:exo-beta-1,3-glucanase (GH17 family)